MQDLRAPLRVTDDRELTPSALVLDGRTLQSTTESGARAGYDVARQRKGSKIHSTVDTLARLLALRGNATDRYKRAQVGALTVHLQEVIGRIFTLPHIHQDYTATVEHGIAIEVVKFPESRCTFLPLPRR